MDLWRGRCGPAGALLLFHGFDPWCYPNDDNGAWFSAVVKSHLNAGLRATHGQDFLTSRTTGKLVPYLQPSPPGVDPRGLLQDHGDASPGTARMTLALMHLVTFALLACHAARVWDPAKQDHLFAWVLAVVATAPVSAYFGKMPNHELPGLLFFLIGVLAQPVLQPGHAAGVPSGRGGAARRHAIGVRCFSRTIVPPPLALACKRYEYEMNVLAACPKMSVPLREVETETVCLDGNRSSHFNSVVDAVKIYSFLLRLSLTSHRR